MKPTGPENGRTINTGNPRYIHIHIIDYGPEHGRTINSTILNHTKSYKANRISTNFPNFNQNSEFQPKFRISTKFQKSTKYQKIYQILDFLQNFRKSTKFLNFDQIPGNQPNFKILTQRSQELRSWLTWCLWHWDVVFLTFKIWDGLSYTSITKILQIWVFIL